MRSLCSPAAPWLLNPSTAPPSFSRLYPANPIIRTPFHDPKTTIGTFHINEPETVVRNPYKANVSYSCTTPGLLPPPETRTDALDDVPVHKTLLVGNSQHNPSTSRDTSIHPQSPENYPLLNCEKSFKTRMRPQERRNTNPAPNQARAQLPFNPCLKPMSTPRTSFHSKKKFESRKTVNSGIPFNASVSHSYKTPRFSPQPECSGPVRHHAPLRKARVPMNPHMKSESTLRTTVTSTTCAKRQEDIHFANPCNLAVPHSYKKSSFLRKPKKSDHEPKLAPLQKKPELATRNHGPLERPTHGTTNPGSKETHQTKIDVTNSKTTLQSSNPSLHLPGKYRPNPEDLSLGRCTFPPQTLPEWFTYLDFMDQHHVHPPHDTSDHIAIDCEMVGCGPKGCRSQLARVSIVDFHGSVLLDTFVDPVDKVTDYRTKYSGVRKQNLTGAPEFSIVIGNVVELIKDKVLVGHSLHHDLDALKLEFPQDPRRDICTLKHLTGTFCTPSLAKLTKKHFGVTIQKGTHCSVDDSRAAMLLYRVFWQRSV